MTSSVQVLTHFREKAHHIGGEAGRLSEQLSDINTRIAALQGALAVSKRMRDALRVSNDAAKAQQSFAHSDKLAIDFERHKRSIVALQARVAELQATQRALTAAATLARVDSVRGAGGGDEPTGPARSSTARRSSTGAGTASTTTTGRPSRLAGVAPPVTGVVRGSTLMHGAAYSLTRKAGTTGSAATKGADGTDGTDGSAEALQLLSSTLQLTRTLGSR